MNVLGRRPCGRSSFAILLEGGTHDFFPYVFERVVYVRNIYQWPELLLKEKPDVVIWVNVEVVLFRGEVVEAWEEKAAAGKNYAGSRACGP